MIPVFVAVFYVSDDTLSLHQKHLLSTFIFWLAARHRLAGWLSGPRLESGFRFRRIS